MFKVEQWKLIILVALGSAVVVTGGVLLIGTPGAEKYGAGLMVGWTLVLAVVARMLLDPPSPTVPASVVARLLGHSQEQEGPRYAWRKNALVVSALIFVLSLVGSATLVWEGQHDLAFGVLGAGMSPLATALVDLIKPSDKEVPLELAMRVADIVDKKKDK